MTAGVRIAFAGMTHLGICSVFAAAQKGFTCIAFDLDASVIADLRNGRFPIFEPGLDELAKANAERVHFTSEPADLASADLCYVAPDVPTDDQGNSDLRPIRALIQLLESALPADATMVVLSQVPPGFNRSLGRAPQRRYCQVETLIFGQAVERALKPERFMVGCADPAEALPAAYASFLSVFGCPVLPMRYESAELAKIAINMFLVSSVTTTNLIAELCEGIGANWQEIAPALRLDRRIGPYAYLAPGLGIGGGNLQRDLATFAEMASTKDVDADLIGVWLRNSQHRSQWARHVLEREAPARLPSPVLGVLGLAYKQDTAATRNSAGLALVRDVPPNWSVRAFDPTVPVEGSWRASTLAQATDEYDAARGTDVLAIMTPWSRFRGLDVGKLARTMRGDIVIDPYGMLDASVCRAAGLRHFQLGRGSEGSARE